MPALHKRTAAFVNCTEAHKENKKRLICMDTKTTSACGMPQRCHLADRGLRRVNRVHSAAVEDHAVGSRSASALRVPAESTEPSWQPPRAGDNSRKKRWAELVTPDVAAKKARLSTSLNHLGWSTAVLDAVLAEEVAKIFVTQRSSLDESHIPCHRAVKVTDVTKQQKYPKETGSFVDCRLYSVKQTPMKKLRNYALLNTKCDRSVGAADALEKTARHPRNTAPAMEDGITEHYSSVASKQLWSEETEGQTRSASLLRRRDCEQHACNLPSRVRQALCTRTALPDRSTVRTGSELQRQASCAAPGSNDSSPTTPSTERTGVRRRREKRSRMTTGSRRRGYSIVSHLFHVRSSPQQKMSPPSERGFSPKRVKWRITTGTEVGYAGRHR